MRDQQVKPSAPAIVVYDRAGSVRFVNEAARALLYSNGERTPFLSALDAVREQLEPVLHRTPVGESGMCRIAVCLPSQRQLQAEVFVPDGDDLIGCVVAMFEDGMERALEEDLYAATRFRSLETLYAGAAHDLRGPLNNMIVNLELLKHGLLNPPGSASAEGGGQTQWVDAIQREIHRLNRHVQTMLDLTAAANEDEPVDLVEVLGELSRLLRATAKLRRVVLDWTLPDRPVFVYGRRDRLRQMLLNIVLNGFEAMAGGGTLHLALVQDGDGVRVDLSNSGAAIPDYVRARLFEKHFTTKTSATGIGLYVAQRLAVQLGGSISFCSEQGEPPSFSVRLPQLRAEHERDPS